MSFVGIDVGARRLHVVVLGDAGHVEDGCVLAATDWETVLAMCRGAECVAIDSPEKLSIAPHRGDTAVDGRTLSNKFRNARCAEIGLGIRHRIWVPWVTPQTDPSEWMKVGIDLFGHLHAASIQAIEIELD